jgi:O-antigen ligase
MTFEHLHAGANRTAIWAAIALGASIPVSVALDNILLAVVLAGWLLGGRFREKAPLFFRHPIGLAAILLFGLLLAGGLYGEAGTGDAARFMGKYTDLLFIPVFLFLFENAENRQRAIRVIAGSLALVLLLSIVIHVGWLPADFASAERQDFVVFKKYLTHNILTAWGAFLFAWLAITANGTRARTGWSALAVLAVANVTLMVKGATGYVILAALVLLLGFGLFRWRGLAAAISGLIVIAALLTLLPGPFQDRVSSITRDAREWQANQPARVSVGFRLEFYRNTLALISERPFLGYGTGGFPQAYARKVEGTGMLPTQNPHNEFLHITAQVGILGLAALLWLFWQQWRLAARLPSRLEREVARGLVTTMVVGCMLNSLLLDHTEGLLFAWLSGVLFAGLKSTAAPRPGDPS